MSKNNDDKRILEIIIAFLKGVATPEEYVFIEEYYRYNVDENYIEQEVTEAEWAKIAERIYKNVNIKITEYYRKNKMKKLFLDYF